MDLPLEDRIDTDLRRPMLVDPTPLGDDLLDPALADIAQASDLHDIDHWVRRHADRGEAIRERALARLTERGTLESDDSATGFLLSRRVSRARHYHPDPDGTVQEEVRLRVMCVLFSDDIPDPRDTVLICLADAGGAFDYLLSREERAEVQNRIDVVTKLDLTGQVVARAVRKAESAAAAAPAARPAREIHRAAGLPLAGNAFDLLGDTERFLLKQYRFLGPIFRVRAFARRFIVLAGPEPNRLLARGNVHFVPSRSGSTSVRTWAPCARSMSMSGGDHVRLRKHQAPADSTGVLKSGMAEAVDLVRREVASWPENERIPGQYMCQRIVLEYYRLQQVNDGLIPLQDDHARPLDGPAVVGSALAGEDAVALWCLIDLVNDGFGTDFNHAGKLFFDQIVEAAAAHEALRPAAGVNPADRFELVFRNVLERLFVDRMDRNEKIFLRYMNDTAFSTACERLDGLRSVSATEGHGGVRCRRHPGYRWELHRNIATFGRRRSRRGRTSV